MRETLDVRNKRLLQLEAQVGHATDFIAARDNPNSNPDNILQAVLQRVEAIELRLAGLQNPPSSNNIVINSCHSTTPDLKERKSMMTQTDPCDIDPDCIDDTPEHVEAVHDVSQAAPLPSLCLEIILITFNIEGFH